MIEKILKGLKIKAKAFQPLANLSFIYFNFRVIKQQTADKI